MAKKRRVITFDSSEQAVKRFRFIMSAVLNGPAAEDARGRRSWDDQKADAKVLRAFKTVSVEKTLGEGSQQIRYRELKEDGGLVRLSPGDFDKLLSWWKKHQWPMYDIDEIEDAFDWLSEAPLEDLDEAPDA